MTIYYVAHVLAYSLQNRHEDALSYVLAVQTSAPSVAQINEWKQIIVNDYIETEFYTSDELHWEQAGDVWFLRSDNDHIDELRVIVVEKTDGSRPDIAAHFGVSPLFRNR
jgi:hypothetical protein